MLYKLHQSHKTLGNEEKLKDLHDAIPFVWGSDGLTQFSERSGAEKFKLYRDQLVAESLMEMMIDSLKTRGTTEDKKDADTLIEILDMLKMGQKKDQDMFSANTSFKKPYAEITASNTPSTSQRPASSNNRPIYAAFMPLQFKNKATTANFYNELETQK